MRSGTFGLVVTDYETLEWLRVYGGEVDRFDKEGIKPLGLRLSGINVPSTKTIGAQLFGLAKLLGLSREALHSPTFSNVTSSYVEPKMTPAMSAALEAQLIGSFRRRHGFPEKARSKLLRGGGLLLERLNELGASYQLSEVSIPNGRMFYHKLIEAWARASGIRISYTEVPVFDPTGLTYFREDFSVHDRTKLHLKYASARNLGVSSLAPEVEWFANRQVSRRENNFLRFQMGGEATPAYRRARKTVAIFTSSPDEFLGLEKGGWECDWKDQYHGFEALLGRLKGNYQFVLRLHPNLANKSVIEYEIETRQAYRLQAKFPNLTILGPSSGANSYDLLRISDLAVVSQSTIGLEAVAMGVPTISVMPNVWDLNLEVPLFHSRMSKLDFESNPQANPHLAFLYLHYQYALNRGTRKSFGSVTTRVLSISFMKAPFSLRGSFLGRRLALAFEIAQNRKRGRFVAHAKT